MWLNKKGGKSVVGKKRTSAVEYGRVRYGNRMSGRGLNGKERLLDSVLMIDVKRSTTNGKGDKYRIETVLL